MVILRKKKAKDKMKVRAVLFIFFLMIISCNKSRLDCLGHYTVNMKSKPVYTEIRIALIDTLNSWAERGLNVQYFKKYKFHLEETVFFNEDNTKALLLGIGTNKYKGQSNYNSVKVFAGEKIDGKWQFYREGLVTFGYTFEKGEDNYSYEYLSNEAKMHIMNDGYLTSSCKINYSYIDSDTWFSEERRKKHEKFLDDK